MPLELSELLINMNESATFAISDKAKKLQMSGCDVINLGVGEPGFNTPDLIKKYTIDAINNNYTKYTPVSGTLSLRKAICEKLKRDNDLDYDISQICVSNGAKHSIFNALKAILNPSDEVIVLTPAWVSYPEMIKVCDAIPVFVECTEKDNFIPNISNIEKAISNKTKAIIINSPCNPTGAVYDTNILNQIALLAKKYNFYIISDEIYEKLTYRTNHVSIASLNSEIVDRVIVINGVSKAYSMTGYRIGYAAGPKSVISLMIKYQGQTTSCANSIAQYASQFALELGESSAQAMKAEFETRRDLMCSGINSIELLSCTIPNGAFYIMINISKVFGKSYKGNTIKNSFDFCNLLLENEYLACVPGEAFFAPEFVRVGFAIDRNKITESINRLKKFVMQLN